MPEPTAQTTTEVTPGYTPGVEPAPATTPEPPKAAEKPTETAEPKKEAAAGKSLIVEKEETPKGEQEPKPGEKPSEDIQIKLPEGVKVDEKFFGDFKNVAKELGLKSDAAQKLVDLHLSYVNRLSKEFEDGVTKQQDEWYSSIEADKDIGGSKLAETTMSVRAAVQKFGGDSFKKEVDAAGLSNWPPLVRFLHKVGQALKNDTTSVEEKPTSTQANDEEAFLRSMYPEMFPQK